MRQLEHTVIYDLKGPGADGKSHVSSAQARIGERGRRVWTATEAVSLGHGGVAAVARATGLAESTIGGVKRNWPSRPLVSLEVIVNLIANTTTDAGRRNDWNYA